MEEVTALRKGIEKAEAPPKKKGAAQQPPPPKVCNLTLSITIHLQQGALLSLDLVDLLCMSRLTDWPVHETQQVLAPAG